MYSLLHIGAIILVDITNSQPPSWSVHIKSNMKDPIHQTIPSDVFCPGRTEADPYAAPNDLQEFIRRIQRLQNADEVDFVATLWS